MSALSILAEECELLNDSKYRSYITQIEKALKSFDSTSEWADLISALGKLNKVNWLFYATVQSLYNTPHYNTDQAFVLCNLTKEFYENEHELSFSYNS